MQSAHSVATRRTTSRVSIPHRNTYPSIIKPTLSDTDLRTSRSNVCPAPVTRNELATFSSWRAQQRVSNEKTLPGRLELPTLRLTASRSNQLSYGSAHASLRKTGCKQCKTQSPAAQFAAIDVLVQHLVFTCQKRRGALRFVDGNTAALFPGSRCPVGRGMQCRPGLFLCWLAAVGAQLISSPSP